MIALAPRTLSKSNLFKFGKLPSIHPDTMTAVHLFVLVPMSTKHLILQNHVKNYLVQISIHMFLPLLCLFVIINSKSVYKYALHPLSISGAVLEIHICAINLPTYSQKCGYFQSDSYLLSQ